MRRLLLLLCAIVFVDTVLYAVVAPLLPHYADDLGLSKASAGILLAAYPAGTLVASLPSGLLAARVGPRRTVLLGLVLLCGASLAFALGRSATALDSARLVQGLAGACTWAGALSWLVTSSPPSRRGELIGTVFGAAIVGALFGPILGATATALGTTPVFGTLTLLIATLTLLAAHEPEPPTTPDALATDDSTSSAAPTALGVTAAAPSSAPDALATHAASPAPAPEHIHSAGPGTLASTPPPAPDAPGTPPRTTAQPASLRATLASRRVRLGMWLVVIPGLGFGVLDVLVPLRLDHLGVGQAGIAATFLIAAAGEALLSPLVGRVADRHGPGRPIRAGLIASALLVLLIPVPDTAPLTIILMVLATGAFGIFWAPSMSMLSAAAERIGTHQGIAFGLVNLAWAAGMVTGAAGGGALAKSTSDAVPCIVLAAICLATFAARPRPDTPGGEPTPAHP
ncbi:MFS transporter [Conexibacter woesei]|uniref:MFS transporter n=1 Tax=Conexibacter woesei TaxID=191495 RepID=UPI0003F76668|nr:MFS transporter [Conexibacter woesei]